MEKQNQDYEYINSEPQVHHCNLTAEIQNETCKQNIHSLNASASVHKAIHKLSRYTCINRQINFPQSPN